MQQLGLRIRGQQKAKYANGGEEMLRVTEALLMKCVGCQTSEDALVISDTVLIGKFVLEKLDLLVDCQNHQRMLVGMRWVECIEREISFHAPLSFMEKEFDFLRDT